MSNPATCRHCGYSIWHNSRIWVHAVNGDKSCIAPTHADPAPMKCKHCARPIEWTDHWATTGIWYHSDTGAIDCLPTTRAEPEEEIDD